MMLSVLTAISAGVTLASIGLMAGVFFAFSVSVMRGLDAIEPGCAIRAMQSINRKILNPVFLLAFMLAPVVGAVTGVLLLLLDETWAAAIMFLAATIYLLGSIVATGGVNVPLNNALDAATVPADPAEAARLWSDYSTRWTRWNTLRALACAVGLLFAGLALFAWGRHW
jgi:uncharacterized membrane protein